MTINSTTENEYVRFASIDVVRGIVLLLMALDHVRTFFSNSIFEPEDIAYVDLVLFITRWVTHYCAPGFFLTAGIAAYMAVSRKSQRSVQQFLSIRGLWFIALELTVIGFAWSFIPGDNFGGVIWAFGWSFIALAAVVPLGPIIVGAIGVSFIALHNAIDFGSLVAAENTGFIAGMLFEPGIVVIPGFGDWFVLFAILPWTAVLFLGYGLGYAYERQSNSQRRRLLVRIGLVSIGLFVLLRLTGWYGNPSVLWISGASSDFEVQSSMAKTIMMFLNTEKYPPSLQYLLMTLGPILVLLGLLSTIDKNERKGGRIFDVLELFGRVPMFFYIIHLYLIHLSALVFALLMGRRYDWLGWMGGGIHPKDGSGYGLLAVYCWFAVVIIALYVMCRWFANIKRSRNWWWLIFV